MQRTDTELSGGIRGDVDEGRGETADRQQAASSRDLLAALFDQYHQRLYRLGLRLCYEHEDAKDLLQDTFLRAARRVRSIPREASGAEAWLVTIMINLCRDQQRKRAVRNRHPAVEIPSAVPKSAPNPEATAVASNSVYKALASLQPRRRAIVVLRDLEDQSVRQVAALLGISEVTVRWHHSAAMRQLKKVLSTQTPFSRSIEER